MTFLSLPFIYDNMTNSPELDPPPSEKPRRHCNVRRRGTAEPDLSSFESAAAEGTQSAEDGGFVCEGEGSCGKDSAGEELGEEVGGGEEGEGSGG